MAFTTADVLEFMQENDVKFVRLAFCNLFGVQKNIAVMARDLADAFENGVCLDTAAVEGFLEGGDADRFLYPDPATLAILPWRPSHGRVARLFCDIRRADGSICPEDGRAVLRRAVQRAGDLGLACQIGCECEFYLFRQDENGERTWIPQDNAGYCDMAPLDRGENVRREICLALEDMGIPSASSHHERGPGQNEIVLHHMDALEAADALVSAHTLIEVIAARNGLWACFAPKPLTGRDGSGTHINLSISRAGKNLFRGDGGHAPEAEGFLAGILGHLAELSAFLNPLPESYLRFGDDVPGVVTWSSRNRNQLVRVPAASDAHARMELRSPDASFSPYLSLALLLEAGIRGVTEGRKLGADGDATGASRIPADLARAVELARTSGLVRDVVPPEALEAYCAHKEAEALRFRDSKRGG